MLSKYVYKFRHILFATLLLLCGVNIFFALQIETSNVSDAILKDSNPIQKAYNWANYELW